DQSPEQVDHVLTARLELRTDSDRELGAGHAGIRVRSASSTSSHTVLALMRSTLASKPRPGRSQGTSIVPACARIGGSTMSSRYALSDPDTSPGKVNPGKLQMATLAARPMPNSCMPPHPTGQARA